MGTSLGIGLGLGMRGVRPRPPIPADASFWLAYNAPQYQDSAGTIPATLTGDPVYRHNSRAGVPYFECDLNLYRPTRYSNVGGVAFDGVSQRFANTLSTGSATAITYGCVLKYTTNGYYNVYDDSSDNVSGLMTWIDGAGRFEVNAGKAVSPLDYKTAGWVGLLTVTNGSSTTINVNSESVATGLGLSVGGRTITFGHRNYSNFFNGAKADEFVLLREPTAAEYVSIFARQAAVIAALS